MRRRSKSRTLWLATALTATAACADPIVAITLPATTPDGATAGTDAALDAARAPGDAEPVDAPDGNRPDGDSATAGPDATPADGAADTALPPDGVVPGADTAGVGDGDAAVDATPVPDTDAAALADGPTDAPPDGPADAEVLEEDTQEPDTAVADAPECTVPADCDDSEACTADACTEGVCVHPAAAGPCSDGNACTAADSCGQGKCVGGKAKSCDDKSACTDDFCLPATGECVNAPNLATCSDNNVCTTGEACVAGKCAGGKPKPCDDANQCTDDACDTKTGTCVHSPKLTACDDGNLCTAGDVCAANACKPGTGVICNDQNDCTNDTCDPKSGKCASLPNTKPCEDGASCTSPDTCKGGACVPGPVNCACMPNSGAKDCNDNNTCTTDTCEKGTGAAKNVCKNAPLSTGTCTDNDACTDADHCAAGKCTGTAKPACDDNNACTQDTCDTLTGTCKFAPTEQPCLDGNACTAADVCKGGACTPGLKVQCDDEDPCTVDACDNGTGQCVHAGVTCAGSKCVPASCNPATGQCVSAPKVCGDGNPCTQDGCNEQTGGCVTVAWKGACADADPCSGMETCATGACKGVAACNDKNTCTLDQCSVAGVCKFTPVADKTVCQDGFACTTGENCQAGICKGAAPKPCADLNNCTVDYCELTAGTCMHQKFGLNCQVCAAGGVCPVGSVCIGGTCAKKVPLGEVCTTAATCDSGMAQCIDDGAGVKRCLQPNKAYGAACGYGGECTSGACPAGVCGCKTTAHCSAAQWCDAGVCAADLAYGATCTDAGQCPTGTGCADSGSGAKLCLATGKLPGMACQWPGECVGKVCLANGLCGCATGAQCGLKQRCNGGSCVPCCAPKSACKPCPQGSCLCGLQTTETCDPACAP